jgi:ABC-type Mn2+/Zn2+ transport system ATPase subunit
MRVAMAVALYKRPDLLILDEVLILIESYFASLLTLILMLILMLFCSSPQIIWMPIL